jgi:hypothetical protein
MPTSDELPSSPGIPTIDYLEGGKDFTYKPGMKGCFVWRAEVRSTSRGRTTWCCAVDDDDWHAQLP